MERDARKTCAAQTKFLYLGRPDESAGALQRLSNHVVNEPMFVPNLVRFKVFAVISASAFHSKLTETKHDKWCINAHLLLVYALENVLEPAVVFLQDGVLRAQIQGHLLYERHLETAVSEPFD